MLLMLGLFGAACGLAGVGVWVEARGRKRSALEQRALVLARLHAGIREQARRIEWIQGR